MERAFSEISTAVIRDSGISRASVTAMQPLPVPTSSTAGLSGAGDSAIQPDQLFGFGTGNQHPFPHLEIEPVKFGMSQYVLQGTAGGQFADDPVEFVDSELLVRFGDQVGQAESAEFHHNDPGDLSRFALAVEGGERRFDPCDDFPACRHSRSVYSAVRRDSSRSKKSGKLLATHAGFSITTGVSAFRAATASDMAMRWSSWLCTCPPRIRPPRIFIVSSSSRSTSMPSLAYSSRIDSRGCPPCSPAGRFL